MHLCFGRWGRILRPHIDTDGLSPTDREKLLKMDAKRREYDVVVIGEESHLAYNRVGLTSFFQHRKVENLYLNPQDWVYTTQSPPDNILLIYRVR